MTDILELDKIEGVAETVKTVGCTDEEREAIKADVEKVKEALAENDKALGLAAPQIGINKQIIAIKFNDSIKIFINPIIKKKQGGAIKPETCSSLPGKEILIGRPEWGNIVPEFENPAPNPDNKQPRAEGSRLFV
jgi:peptide deformylase